MPIKREFFEKQNFVLTLIYGKINDQELVEHVMAMIEEYANISGIKELADCRYLTDVSGLSGQGIFGSARREEGSSRVIGGKGALLPIMILSMGWEECMQL